MICICLKGRLGNQMFQYSFARYIQTITNDNVLILNTISIDKKSKFDSSWCNELKNFKITNVLESNSHIYCIMQKVLLKIILMKVANLNTEQRHVYELKIVRLLNKIGIFLMTDGYFPFDIKCSKRSKLLSGYFESPLYFKEIDDLLRKEFTPKYPILKSNNDLYEKIISFSSICVSIRRGDFFEDNTKQRFAICTPEYYYAAINYIKQHKPQSIVIVFSDDIIWVKENMKFDEPVFYEKGSDPVWEKLRLMYSCNHFVISNSTFSWWAQHLGNRSGKIVVAPTPWRNDAIPIDIYEKNWVLMNTLGEIVKH